jgi:hypothetical protein
MDAKCPEKEPRLNHRRCAAMTDALTARGTAISRACICRLSSLSGRCQAPAMVTRRVEGGIRRRSMAASGGVCLEQTMPSVPIRRRSGVGCGQSDATLSGNMRRQSTCFTRDSVADGGGGGGGVRSRERRGTATRYAHQRRPPKLEVARVA